MTVEFMQKLSIIFFIASGVFLIISVILFFVLNISKIYGDISGKTAKKAIEKIRQQNKDGKVNYEKVKKNKNIVVDKNPQNKCLDNDSENNITTILYSSEMTENNNSKIVKSEFIIEKNICFISSFEIIE